MGRPIRKPRPGNGRRSTRPGCVVLAFGRAKRPPDIQVAIHRADRDRPCRAHDSMAVLRKYLLEDVIVPFSDADSIMRTLLMFAFFEGSTPRRYSGRHPIDRGGQIRRPRHWG